MEYTSREIVKMALACSNPPRVPRQLWTLPWAENHYPNQVAKIRQDFPADIVSSPSFLAQGPKTIGDAYEIGEFVDAWGAVFENKSSGIIGEVRQPLIVDEDWNDTDKAHIPEELLTVDCDKVNNYCRAQDKFVIAGACPRPFERLQFLRGTEQLYMDLMFKPRKMMEFIQRIHDFYCRQLRLWAKTDVDALTWMDDWGAQNALLINPKMWREIFKPMYRDYIEIAHSHGKTIFMHSDGFTLPIIPDLIDLGLDALNTQIFCIGIEKLERFTGQITFWGEIDRQNLLPYATEQEIRAAVDEVYKRLWRNGGCIAQCEFGAGANPDNVYAVFDQWNKVTERERN